LLIAEPEARLAEWHEIPAHRRILRHRRLPLRRVRLPQSRQWLRGDPRSRTVPAAAGSMQLPLSIMCVTIFGGCSTRSFYKSIVRHSHFFLANAIIDFASAGIRPTRTKSIDLSPASSRKVLSVCADQNLTYPSSHRGLT
jgi:hypothetical protein